MDNNDLQMIYKYVKDNPGSYGYLVALYHESFWNKFHTAVVLRCLCEEGYLRREEDTDKRFKYWVAKEF